MQHHRMDRISYYREENRDHDDTGLKESEAVHANDFMDHNGMQVECAYMRLSTLHVCVLLGGG